MSIFSPPKWFRRRQRRWRVVAVVLLLFGLFAHPMSQAFAQQTNNTATADYLSDQGASIEAVSNQVINNVVLPLIDPTGQILGCDGQPLASYDGFSVALYEPDASGLGLGGLVELTPSTGADSIAPNVDNDRKSTRLNSSH